MKNTVSCDNIESLKSKTEKLLKAEEMPARKKTFVNNSNLPRHSITTSANMMNRKTQLVLVVNNKNTKD